MEKKKMIMIGGGAAVAIAVGVGAFLFLGKEDPVEEPAGQELNVTAPDSTATAPDATGDATGETAGAVGEDGDATGDSSMLEGGSPDAGGLAPDMSGTVDLTGGSSGDMVEVDTSIPPVLTEAIGSMSAKVIQVYPKLIMSSNTTGQLVSVTASGDYTTLAPGSNVSIEYNVVGSTTYPQEIIANSITLMGSGTDMVGAYVIMATKALGGSMDTLPSYKYIALDISDVRNLSAGDIDAFLWKMTSLAGNGSVVFFHTRESLEEEGYIRDGNFENGVLFEFSSMESEGEGDFNYSASRWSSDTNFAQIAGRAETDMTGGFSLSS